MAVSWPRVAAVTLGLTAVGAVVGAALGSLVLLVLALPRLLTHPTEVFAVSLLVGTASGAPMGAVGAPLVSWLLLRHVPIGRALAATSVGTVAGSFLGLAVVMLAEGGELAMLGLVAGAPAGLVASAVWLRIVTSRRPPRLP